ncbi:hypothetical protein AAHQ84_14245 [Listeria monocytogenes]|uniref:hypothetical protein n=2 Tax=Listeria monocytogenes TaxID=1639 RepID=UPI002905F5C9|nr:hypothetical protein [Listeria monocytogenes]
MNKYQSLFAGVNGKCCLIYYYGIREGNMKIQTYENKLVKDELEIDYYVPITITFPENADKYRLGELYYFLFINEHDSLVEVKINAITQKIVELVVVSINDIEDSNLVIEKYTEKKPINSNDYFRCLSNYN